MLPTRPDVNLHQREFADVTGTDGAHDIAMKTAKGLALLGLKVLEDEELASKVRTEFERSDAIQA